MLINTEHRDAVEAVRVVDQHPAAFGQHRRIGGVPANPETVSDPGNREVLDHERGQRPGQAAARQLRSRLRRLRHVLPPDPTAVRTPIATHSDHERCRPVPERGVCDDPALQPGTIRLDPLPDHLQPERAGPTFTLVCDEPL